MDVLAAAARAKPTRRRSGGRWRSATCRPSPPITRPTPSTRRGKLRAGPNPTFKQIANGMPGLESRLPVLFDAMVSKGRLGLEKFVELTATAPAKIYNLTRARARSRSAPMPTSRSGTRKQQVTLTDAAIHDRAGYTPYAGRTVTGWPVTVLRRGEVIVADGTLRAKPGSGRFLPRTGGRRRRAGRTARARDGPGPQFRGGALVRGVQTLRTAPPSTRTRLPVT